MSIVDDHDGPSDYTHPQLSGRASRSESDLSEPDPEVINGINVNTQNGIDSMEHAVQDMETSESDADADGMEDDDEDAEGEDDADYDVESLGVEEDDIRPASQSSHSSIRPGKRKASIDEEDFVLQNPELYGLRRSV